MKLPSPWPNLPAEAKAAASRMHASAEKTAERQVHRHEEANILDLSKLLHLIEP